MVVLAQRDVGADLGAALDQPFVFQRGERFPNGVARHREFGGQLRLPGQAVVISAGVDLVAQYVGDLTRTIGARLTDRQWYGHVATLTPGLRSLGDRHRVEWPRGYCAASIPPPPADTA